MVQNITDKQRAAIKALAERYNSDLDHTDVLPNAFGLPDGWAHVAVWSPKCGASTTEPRVAVVAGVSPDGDVHT